MARVGHHHPVLGARHVNDELLAGDTPQSWAQALYEEMVLYLNDGGMQPGGVCRLGLGHFDCDVLMLERRTVRSAAGWTYTAVRVHAEHSDNPELEWQGWLPIAHYR